MLLRAVTIAYPRPLQAKQTAIRTTLTISSFGVIVPAILYFARHVPPTTLIPLHSAAERIMDALSTTCPFIALPGCVASGTLGSLLSSNVDIATDVASALRLGKVCFSSTGPATSTKSTILWNARQRRLGLSERRANASVLVPSLGGVVVVVCCVVLALVCQLLLCPLSP